MGRAKVPPKAKSDPGLAASLARDPDVAQGWSWADSKNKKVRKKAIPRILVPPQECVAKGAAWLDILSPSWFRRLDPQEVDVQSVLFCPLSNAFPDERMLCRPGEVVPRKDSSLLHGPLSLSAAPARPKLPAFRGSDTDQLASCGFAPYRDDPHPDPYEILNQCWAAEIQKRQSSPHHADSAP
jgi:hypothetical protein